MICRQGSTEVCQEVGPAILSDVSGADSNSTACPEGGQRNAGIHTVRVSRLQQKIIVTSLRKQFSFAFCLTLYSWSYWNSTWKTRPGMQSLVTSVNRVHTLLTLKKLRIFDFVRYLQQEISAITINCAELVHIL